MEAATLPEHVCQCAEPGKCEFWGRVVNADNHALCSGPDTPERHMLLMRWGVSREQRAGRPVVAAPKILNKPAHDCVHLSTARLKADGSKLTKQCGTCSKKVELKLFGCGHALQLGREITIDDCERCRLYERRVKKPEAWTLVNPLSPGDILVMTAAVASLHKAYPGEYATAVDSPCPDLWAHNPHVTPAAPKARKIEMHYPLIDQSNQELVPFLKGYCDFLAGAIGRPIPLATNRPHLYLSSEELGWAGRITEILGRPRPYWLLVAGTKQDYTAKQWPWYQELVDRLQGRVLFVQVGATEHNHRPLKGVIDQTGKTNLRELIRLAYHAAGGVGPSTLLQHLCAAWEKPYVCLLGGREPVSWVQYPRQTTLHTIGALDCCRHGACWRSRTVALGDGDEKDKSLCALPVFTDPPAPACMARITAEEVARVIDRHD